MIEIIPNMHPFLVHFTIGLLITSVALFFAGMALKAKVAGHRLTIAARWNLWIGTGFAFVTVAAGYQAYNTVAHDDLGHAAMILHLKWAWVALLLFVAAAGLAWRDRLRPAGAALPLALMLLLGAAALSVTGYLGAENVYRHGLGVMRLPQIESPDHDHGGPTEGALSDDARVSPEHDSGAGHDHR